MARFSRRRLSGLWKQCDQASTTAQKGRALEDLLCYLFGTLPGIELWKRNELNAFGTEEVDVAFWNGQHQSGVPFLPNVILVACKNWSSAVGSQEVAYFAQRLQHRGCDYGILLAANGIPGLSEDLTRAHYEIAMALANKCRVIVLTRAEIEELSSANELIVLLKSKLCELVVSGTVFLS